MNANNRAASMSRHGKTMGRPPVPPEEERLMFQQLRVACREASDLLLTVAEETPNFVLEFDRGSPVEAPTYGDVHHALKLLAEQARKRERR